MDWPIAAITVLRQSDSSQESTGCFLDYIRDISEAVEGQSCKESRTYIEVADQDLIIPQIIPDDEA